MFRQYLNRVRQTLSRSRRKSRSAKLPRTSRPPSAHLALEGLEERALPSVLSLSNGALTYTPSTSFANSLSISDDSATHRYTFVDTAENISLVGNFLNPSGNFSHSVSFGDGNITSIAVNTFNQDFTVNIEQTLAFVPVTVYLGNGTDTVSVSPVAHNLTNIQGAINVHLGLGTDSLNVDDQSSSGSQTFTMDSSSVRRSGSATITYGNGIDFVTINAGNGANTYNVSGTEPADTTTLNTGNGNDKVNVDGSGFNSTFNINDGTGGVDVNLGASPHTLENLNGDVYVNGAIQGVDNLVLNDTANNSAHLFTLGTYPSTNSIARTGSGTAVSIYYNFHLSNVTINSGTGANSFDVLGTGASTYIVAHANATVDVGNNGSLAHITHDLTISDPPAGAYATVSVDDSADTTFHTVTLQTVGIGGANYGLVAGLAANIAYKYSDTNSVTVQTGTGGATANVWATSSPVHLVGHANGTVNVGSLGELTQIASPLTITDPHVGTHVHVNVDDSMDLNPRTALLDSVTIGGALYGRITGITPPSGAIQYKYAETDMVNVQTNLGYGTVNVLATGVPVVLGGHGNDTVYVESTTAPLTINLSNGTDNVTISGAAHNLNNIQGAVTIHAGPGFDTLNVDDQANSASEPFTMTASAVSRMGSALITYGPGINHVFISGGSGNNTYNVSGTEAVFPTTLETGGGNDTVNVESTNGPLTVNLGNGTDYVTVSGVAHNLSNIQGAIIVNAGQGLDQLNVDDQANGASEPFTMTALSVSRMGSALITYGPGIYQVVISGGGGNNTYNVNGTEAGFTTTLETGGGNDTVNVEATSGPLVVNLGNGTDSVNVSPVAQNLNNIQGSVTIQSGLGTDTLNVNDQASAASRTFTMFAISVSRSGSALISYSPGISIYVNGGSGDNTYNIGGTEASLPTTLNTGGGTDMVNVEATSGPLVVNLGSGTDGVNVSPAAQNLDNIQGAVTLQNGGGTATLTVNDQASGASQTFSMTASSVSRLGSPLISYGPGINQVSLNGGSGNNTYNVTGTSPFSSSTTVNTGGGSDVVYVGLGGTIAPIQSALSVNGQGGVTILGVYDQNGGVGLNYSLGSSELDRDGAGPILYSGIQGLTVYTANASIFHANSTAAGTPVLASDAGSMQLLASDVDSTWNITGHNAGTLSSSLLAGIVTFAGATSLQGGAGADYFTFADGAGVDGTINGGGGVNTLDYSAYSTSVTVDLNPQVGSATGVGLGVSNIQNVIGGSGGAAGTYNLLIGSGGNVLTGGTGRRNILVAGASASTLNGGNQDDLLIAGSTAFDSDPAMTAWSQIAAEWASSDDFGTRVMKLGTGNGVPLLDPTTVFGNGGGNLLTGAGELAWIFSDGLDAITNFDPNSQTVTING
jgi:acrosin